MTWASPDTCLASIAYVRGVTDTAFDFYSSCNRRHALALEHCRMPYLC